MHLEAFKQHYQQFRTARTLAFGTTTVKKLDTETNAAFLLRLAQWYEPHLRSGDAVDKIFDAARSIGADFLDLVFLDWAGFEANNRTYLAQQGYCELANVWLFTTPLQVLNHKKIKAPEFNDVPLTNWRNVVLLDLNSSATRNPFYAIYRATDDIEAFPTSDMAHVDKEMHETETPASLLATAQEHNYA